MQIIGALGGLGVVVALVAQGVKKSFRLDEKDTKLAKASIHAVVLAATTLAGYAQYVVQFHSKLPVDVLGISGASIYGVSQVVYKFSKLVSRDGTALENALAPAQPISDNAGLEFGLSGTTTAPVDPSKTPASF